MTAAVIREFGGGVGHTLIPMAKPARGRSVADPVRKRYTFEGVFEWPWDRAIVHPTEAMESTRAPTMTVHRRCLPYQPIHGDRMIVRFDCEELVFEIIDIRRDGESAITFDLSQMGLQG